MKPGNLSGDSQLSTALLSIGGPRVDTNTEQPAAFVFTGLAGQSIAIRANRPWSLYDPLGVRVDADQTTATNLIDTGRYLLLLEAGLTPPASVKIFPVDPAALVLPATVGQPITFDLQEPRAQYARLSLGGGRRYRLVVPSGQKATVCVTEFEGGSLRNQRCVPSPSPLSNQAAAALIFVMRSDLDVQVRASADNPYDGVPVTTVSARIEEMASDVLPHQLRRRSSTSSRKKGRA